MQEKHVAIAVAVAGLTWFALSRGKSETTTLDKAVIGLYVAMLCILLIHGLSVAAGYCTSFFQRNSEDTLLDTPDDLRARAIHEGAHAFVAWLSSEVGEVLSVVIDRNGGNSGETTRKPSPGTYYTRSEMISSISVKLASKAAFDVVGQEPNSGCIQDIDQATLIAWEMVARFGMSEVLGHRSYDDQDMISPQTKAIIDAEVTRLTDLGYRKARRLLEERRPAFDSLADELVEKKMLVTADLVRILGPRPKAA